MTRRLHFLFPDVKLTRQVVNDLIANEIGREHIHVLARNDIDFGDLPQSTMRQKNVYASLRVLCSVAIRRQFPEALAGPWKRYTYS